MMALSSLWRRLRRFRQENIAKILRKVRSTVSADVLDAFEDAVQRRCLRGDIQFYQLIHSRQAACWQRFRRHQAIVGAATVVPPIVSFVWRRRVHGT